MAKHVDYMGIPLVIEYEKGEFRPSEDSPIPNMGHILYADYGYIEGTYTGSDDEEWDVFLGPDLTVDDVYILPIHVPEADHNTMTSYRTTNFAPFDEMKFLFGFPTTKAAIEFARMQYPGYVLGGDMLECMTVEEFQQALEQNEPLAQKMEREQGQVAKEGPESEVTEAEDELEFYEYIRPDELVELEI